MKRMSSTTRKVGSVHDSQSRVKDRWREAGVWPRSSGNRSASRPNTIATSTWPVIFARLRRPRLRCLATLM